MQYLSQLLLRVFLWIVSGSGIHGTRGILVVLPHTITQSLFPLREEVQEEGEVQQVIQVILKLYITNGYTPSLSELSELLSCISALPNQLKYLLDFVPFTYIYVEQDKQECCAYYKVDKRMVYLYLNNSITQATILHEMFHAWQHNQGYILSGETFENSYYNIEFETYVTIDVFKQKEYGFLNSLTAGDKNRSEYQDFIEQCFNNGTFNYSIFISRIYDFYYSFIDSHRRKKDMEPINGTIPTAAELDNPNYTWHWSTYFSFWRIIE